MKLHRIIWVPVLALLLGACTKDNTVTDLRKLDKPVIVNLSEVFNNIPYKVRQDQELVISPEISYKDMSDLRYEWKINGEIVSRERELHWINESKSSGHFGSFAIFRISAGNADIYSFSVQRDIPYKSGIPILAKKDGKLVVHFLKCLAGSAGAGYLEWEFLPDAAPGLDLPASKIDGSRVFEYWQCVRGETADDPRLLGKLMLVNSDPDICQSLNEETLDAEVKLPQEFRNEQVPAGLQVKDIMYGGYMSYVLGTDGKVYSRVRSQNYYTGRYQTVPMTYQADNLSPVEELNVSAFLPLDCYTMNYSACLMYEPQKRRFIVVDTDYSTVGSTKAGAKSVLVDAKMVADKQAELIFGSHLKPQNRDPDPTAMSSCRFWALFKGTDNGYYARQFRFIYGTSVASNEYTEGDGYVKVTDMNERSVIHVINTVQEALYGYVYYTDGVDQKTLYVRKRNASSMDEARKFHTFEKNIVGMSSFVTASLGVLCIAFDDGSVMVYAARILSVYSDETYYTELKPERILLDTSDPDSGFGDLGEIIYVGKYKWGLVTKASS